MNKKRSEWANEEGSALVLTLMIFLVLTVLATSISFLTVGSFRLSDINRDGTSAFYIAEAGAKKAYEKASQEVMKTYEATTTTTSSDFYAALDALFLNKERPFSFDKQFGDDAKANVTFTATGSNPRKYTLTSTGSVGGKTRTVQKQFDVAWVDKGGSGGLPELPKNAALMTKGKTEIIGNSLTGNIYTTAGDTNTTSTGEKNFIIDNPTFNNTTIFHSKNTIFSYHSWYENNKKMPARQQTDSVIDWLGYENLLNNIKIPEKSSSTETIPNISLSGGDPPETLKITSREIYMSKVEIQNNRVLILEPAIDTIIFVDNWNTAARRIEIKGDKKVTIVVKNSLNIGSTPIFNGNKMGEGSPNQLTLIYLGQGDFSFSNWSGVVNANILLKNVSSVSLPNLMLNGLLVYPGNGDVKLSGGNKTSNAIIITPNAKVSITTGYSLNGTVIANTFKLEGGASLTYAKIDTSGFPGISGGATSTPTLEDLLKSGPILEQ